MLVLNTRNSVQRAINVIQASKAQRRADEGRPRAKQGNEKVIHAGGHRSLREPWLQSSATGNVGGVNKDNM